jgi:hypothetical protein
MHEVKNLPQRFTVTERLLLLPILQSAASSGNITTIRIQADLERELGFTEEEAGAIHLRQEGDQVLWDLGADPVKEIQIGPIGMSLIVKALRRASQMELLNTVHIPLWDRFVGPVEEAEATAAAKPVAVASPES